MSETKTRIEDFFLTFATHTIVFFYIFGVGIIELLMVVLITAWKIIPSISTEPLNLQVWRRSLEDIKDARENCIMLLSWLWDLFCEDIKIR